MSRIFNFNSLLICLLILFCGCSVSSISVKPDKLGGISKIAILPFETDKVIPDSVKADSEETFRSALVKSGFSIVDGKSMVSIISGINGPVSDKRLSEIRILTGADAVLLGYIDEYSEDSRFSFNRASGFIFHPGVRSIKKDDENDIVEIRYFHFKIHIRILSLATGETIIAMENRYSSTASEPLLFESLSEYERYILAHMGRDLIKIFKERELK